MSTRPERWFQSQSTEDLKEMLSNSSLGAAIRSYVALYERGEVTEERGLALLREAATELDALERRTMSSNPSEL